MGLLRAAQALLLPLAAATGGVDQCHRYRGSIFGLPLGAATTSPSPSACEAACAANASCYAWTYTPPLPSGSAAPPTGAACTVYNNSNIGRGQNLPGTPTPEPSAAACCALCEGTAACASWTWALAAPGATSAPCWLHPAAGSPSPSGAGQHWVSGLQHNHSVVQHGSCQLKEAPPQSPKACTSCHGEHARRFSLGCVC